MALSVKDIKFAEGILQGKSVVDAAMEAGFAKSTAYKQAHLWIGKTRKDSEKPELFDYVQDKRKKLEDEFTVSRNQVLRGMLRIADADIRLLYDKDGNLLPPHLLPDEIVGAIVGIEVQEIYGGTGKDKKAIGQVKKYKLAADRNGAWGSIAKLLGYNEAEKVEITGSFLDFLKKAKQGK